MYKIMIHDRFIAEKKIIVLSIYILTIILDNLVVASDVYGASDVRANMLIGKMSSITW